MPMSVFLNLATALPVGPVNHPILGFVTLLGIAFLTFAVAGVFMVRSEVHHMLEGELIAPRCANEQSTKLL